MEGPALTGLDKGSGLLAALVAPAPGEVRGTKISEFLICFILSVFTEALFCSTPWGSGSQGHVPAMAQSKGLTGMALPGAVW